MSDNTKLEAALKTILAPGYLESARRRYVAGLMNPRLISALEEISSRPTPFDTRLAAAQDGARYILTGQKRALDT